MISYIKESIGYSQFISKDDTKPFKNILFCFDGGGLFGRLFRIERIKN
jgi:hypothetical protein